MVLWPLGVERWVIAGTEACLLTTTSGGLTSKTQAAQSGSVQFTPIFLHTAPEHSDTAHVCPNGLDKRERERERAMQDLTGRETQVPCAAHVGLGQGQGKLGG